MRLCMRENKYVCDAFPEFNDDLCLNGFTTGLFIISQDTKCVSHDALPLPYLMYICDLPTIVYCGFSAIPIFLSCIPRIIYLLVSALFTYLAVY